MLTHRAVGKANNWMKTEIRLCTTFPSLRDIKWWPERISTVERNAIVRFRKFILNRRRIWANSRKTLNTTLSWFAFELSAQTSLLKSWLSHKDRTGLNSIPKIVTNHHTIITSKLPNYASVLTTNKRWHSFAIKTSVNRRFFRTHYGSIVCYIDMKIKCWSINKQHLCFCSGESHSDDPYYNITFVTHDLTNGNCETPNNDFIYWSREDSIYFSKQSKMRFSSHESCDCITSRLSEWAWLT